MSERALVISSSGVRLAYEIGVLRGAVSFTTPAERAWKHVYGSSGGALVAAFLCMYPLGEEDRAVTDLKALAFRFLGENGMRSYSPFGWIQGLLWNKAAFDPSFLRSVVQQFIDPTRIRDSGRNLYIVAVDYCTSQPRIFTERDWPILHEAIIASCSIPLLFPPSPIPDASSPTGVKYFGDGGMTDFVPLERAAHNPSVAHVDVVLSVGSAETRVIDLAKNGQYPGLGHQLHALLESFYKLSADRANEVLVRVNLLVDLKRKTPGEIDITASFPPSESGRIGAAVRGLQRENHVSARIYSPLTPLRLTSVGDNENLSEHLWDVGVATAREILRNEREGVPRWDRARAL